MLMVFHRFPMVFPIGTRQEPNSQRERGGPATAPQVRGPLRSNRSAKVEGQ